MPTQSTYASPGQYGAYGSSPPSTRPLRFVSSAFAAAEPFFTAYLPPTYGYPSPWFGAQRTAAVGAPAWIASATRRQAVTYAAGSPPHGCHEPFISWAKRTIVGTSSRPYAARRSASAPS